jgi:hypothetical protein
MLVYFAGKAETEISILPLGVILRRFSFGQLSFGFTKH